MTNENNAAKKIAVTPQVPALNGMTPLGIKPVTETETHYYGWNTATKSHGWIAKTKIVVIDYSNKSVGFRFAHNNVMFRWNRSHSVAERFLAQHRREYQIISRHWSTAKPIAKWMAD